MEFLLGIISIFSIIYGTIFLYKISIWVLPYILYILSRLLCILFLISLFTLNFTPAIILFVLTGFSEILRQFLIKPAILAMLKRMGMGTPEQISKKARKSIDDTTTILKELSEKGKIEAVPLANGVAYKLHGDNITGENFASTTTEIEIN